MSMSSDDLDASPTNYSLLMNQSLAENQARTYSVNSVSDAMEKYYSLVLLVFGTVGNVLSFAVLSRNTFRVTTVSVYLRFLSLSDLATLYTGDMYFTAKALFNVNVRQTSVLSCKFHRWLSFTFCDTSSWALVLVSSARLISIVWPMKRLSTHARAYVAIVVTVIICLAANFPIFIMYGDREEPARNKTKLCTTITDSWDNFYTHIFGWLVLLKFAFLPGVLLIILNTALVISVSRSSKAIDKIQSHAMEETGSSIAAIKKMISLWRIRNTRKINKCSGQTTESSFVINKEFQENSTSIDNVGKDNKKTEDSWKFHFDNFLPCLKVRKKTQSHRNSTMSKDRMEDNGNCLYNLRKLVLRRSSKSPSIHQNDHKMAATECPYKVERRVEVSLVYNSSENCDPDGNGLANKCLSPTSGNSSSLADCAHDGQEKTVTCRENNPDCNMSSQEEEDKQASTLSSILVPPFKNTASVSTTNSESASNPTVPASDNNQLEVTAVSIAMPRAAPATHLYNVNKARRELTDNIITTDHISNESSGNYACCCQTIEHDSENPCTVCKAVNNGENCDNKANNNFIHESAKDSVKECNSREDDKWTDNGEISGDSISPGYHSIHSFHGTPENDAADLTSEVSNKNIGSNIQVEVDSKETNFPLNHHVVVYSNSTQLNPNPVNVTSDANVSFQQSSSQEQLNTPSSQRKASKRPRSKTHQAANSQRKSKSLTRTLLAINTLFLVCNAPITIYLSGKVYLWPDNSYSDSKELFVSTANFMMYTNNAINFIFYCLTGTRFRSELILMFKDLFHIIQHLYRKVCHSQKIR